MYEVRQINPGKKKRASTARKGKKKTMARKKTSRRRATPRRRRRTTTAAAAPRRRRRRRNPGAMAVNPRRRRSGGRRRRRNPGLPGMGELTSELKAGLPRLAGKVAVAAAIKLIKEGKMFGAPSTLAGEPWGWQQYAVAAGVAMFAPKLLGKFISPTEFRRGAVDLMLTKALWTGVISRSPEAQKWLGELAEGTQIYDDDGQGWIVDNGQQHAMQGLVTKGPLDGLVTKGPLDGLLPLNTPREEAIKSAYRGTGSSDPYAY